MSKTWLQDDSTYTQVGFKLAQISLKLDQHWFEVGLKLDQVGFKLAPTGLNWLTLARDGSKWLQVRSNWPQVGLKLASSWLKLASSWPHLASSRLNLASSWLKLAFKVNTNMWQWTCLSIWTGSARESENQSACYLCHHACEHVFTWVLERSSARFARSGCSVLGASW